MRKLTNHSGHPTQSHHSVPSEHRSDLHEDLHNQYELEFHPDSDLAGDEEHFTIPPANYNLDRPMSMSKNNTETGPTLDRPKSTRTPLGEPPE
eukprot:g66297.t1